MKNLIFNYKNIEKVAGCDEAGRGCLAGPVVAAAVILSKPIPSLNDSKQLNKAKRNLLRTRIEEEALAYGVAFVDHKEIDRINILNASFLAMHKALDKLESRPDFILIDGNRFTPYPDIDHETVIKGDGKFQCIAAASILAKTYRDEYMTALHKEHPHYGWDSNAGYPTKKHREGIRKHGSSPYHRKSFRLLPEQLKLL